MRKELHLKENVDQVTIPYACFKLCGYERKEFCYYLNSVEFPYGFASKICRCVNVSDCKIFGIESYDGYIFM